MIMCRSRVRKLAMLGAVVMILPFQGCTVTSCGDYTHFIFSQENGLKVTEVGVPKNSQLNGVDAFPLHYKLVRSGYQVDIDVNEAAFGPSVMIKATSGSEDISVRIVTKTKPRNSQRYCFSYSYVGNQLYVSWLGGQGCEAISAFEIAVQLNQENTETLEVLPFVVVKNGRYCVEDGP